MSKQKGKGKNKDSEEQEMKEKVARLDCEMKALLIKLSFLFQKISKKKLI